MGCFPPQGISALLKEALVVYKGVTDAAGGAGGTTLKCSDLATKADWDGNQIIITSGTYEGQARDINGATNNATGTVTPANAFGGVIASGVTFVITGIRTVPAEVAALQADVGDFSAQTNLKSLLAVLGSGWNTANKDLYTAIITDQLGHGTHGLSALETLVDDLETRLTATRAGYLDILNSDSKYILSTALTAPTVNSLTKFIASGGTGLGRILPTSMSLIDLFGNFTGPYDGAAQDDNVKASLDLLHTHAGEKSVGKLQIATTTENLNQGIGSYDLLTGTTQSVILEKLVIRMPTEAAGGSITSISIQTDDVTPSVIINSTDGAVANLTSEAQLAWTGAIEIPVGTKIQLSIAGGAHGSIYTTTIVAQCRAVVAEGYLS